MNDIVMICPYCGERMVMLKKNKGKTIAKRIEKIDRKGNVVERYRSINDAACKNPLSRNAIKNRLNGKIKKDEYELSGYSFRYVN